MRLACPSCSAAIAAEDIDLPRSQAKCRACGEVFAFAVPPASAAAVAVPRPRGVEEVEDLSGLRISWRWYTPSVWFLAFFCVFWDGFLVVWYAMALHVPAKSGAVMLLPLLFPLLHVGVGVGLTYQVLATFLDRTVVAIADGVLTIRHEPLPSRRPRPLRTDEIRQCYVRRRTSTGRGGTTRFDLVALVADESVRLVQLEHVEHALWLEERIERHLRLTHRPVPDEVRQAG